MFRQIVLLSLVAATVAGAGIAQAAPTKPQLQDQKAIDRWVEVFRPWELVGPPVDPSGPLHQVNTSDFDPQPDPPHTTVKTEVIVAH